MALRTWWWRRRLRRGVRFTARELRTWRAWYRDYLRTPGWRRRRAQAVARARGHCEECGRACRGLQVHHVSYGRLGRERLCDLRALCPRCHLLKHGRGVLR